MTQRLAENHRQGVIIDHLMSVRSAFGRAELLQLLRREKLGATAYDHGYPVALDELLARGIVEVRIPRNRGGHQYTCGGLYFPRPFAADLRDRRAQLRAVRRVVRP